ncbi:hypothetical protein GCM10023314_04310 [Algibacter agarivorans]|uniref:N-acetyltransferase domain-containing protein n=1 Tax=Algibacter agarivorans TaxID=1109741 RepID=A0ABP9GB43_9FLAO
MVDIISFEKLYAKDFYDLNTEWLRTFFFVEPYDEDVLSKPEQYIINKGGHLFFAKLKDDIVGTVVLMPIGNKGHFELTKMAVSPKHRGQKIDQKLIQHCINFTMRKDIPKLIIYSSRKLESAIYIYRKHGFIEIPVEPDCHYKRCDIKMELVV